MGERIKTVFESGTLKIEYDINLAEVKYHLPSTEWTSENDAVQGALALLSFVTRGSLGTASPGPFEG